MQKHSSLERGNETSASKSLWPDCAIEVDPYRLPAHIELEVPNPVFSFVSVSRTVSIYTNFVVIFDRMGPHSMTLRIVALVDFDAIVVRVGFCANGIRQIGSAVYLHHATLGLELPLYAATDCRDTAAFWLSWSRVLGVPAMSVGKDGVLFDPFNKVGKLHVGESLSRRPVVSHTAYRPTLRRQSAHQQRRITKTVERSGCIDQQTGSNVYRLFS